jgi:hypothetical protein
MKNTLITATILLASFGASAGMKVFQPQNANNPTFEDHVCISAAEGGLTAAHDLVREAGQSTRMVSQTLLCNGVSLQSFANMYWVKTPSQKSITTVRLQAHDDDESRFCKDAVIKGIEGAVTQYGERFKNTMCNGLTVTRFVAQLQGKVVQ